jgi:hypothetical protein
VVDWIDSLLKDEFSARSVSVFAAIEDKRNRMFGVAGL